MAEQHSVFCMEAIRRRETVDRDRLANEPGDMNARINLAWCLFLQALYQAGQESILSELVSANQNIDSPASAKLVANLDRNASLILKDCLYQAFTVSQLSAKPEDNEEIAKLRRLVELFGAKNLVSQAHEESERILEQITHEILHGPNDGTSSAFR